MLDARLNRDLLNFVEHINGVESVKAAWLSTLSFMFGLGASHVGFKIGLETEKPLFLSTIPQWASDMYMETVYPDSDPRLEHCRKNEVPYFYGREFWNQEKDIPASRRSYDEELAGIEMQSMVAIPVHPFVSKPQGIFAYAAGMSGREFRRMYCEQGTAIHLGSMAAFNRIYDLSQNGQTTRARLTERERECLSWLGRGMRNDQIADRLGLSRVTVEFHILNARKKLNARTREQALVKAIQRKIIQP